MAFKIEPNILHKFTSKVVDPLIFTLCSHTSVPVISKFPSISPSLTLKIQSVPSTSYSNVSFSHSISSCAFIDKSLAVWL